MPLRTGRGLLSRYTSIEPCFVIASGMWGCCVVPGMVQAFFNRPKARPSMPQSYPASTLVHPRSESSVKYEQHYRCITFVLRIFLCSTGSLSRQRSERVSQVPAGGGQPFHLPQRGGERELRVKVGVPVLMSLYFYGGP